MRGQRVLVATTDAVHGGRMGRDAGLLVDIVVFDGVDELDAVGPLEVFRSAALIGGDVAARLVAHDGATTVTGGFGLRVEVDAAFAPGAADIVVVTGGGWRRRRPASVWGEVQRGDWQPLLVAARGAGAVLAGVCTGSLLLAHAGLVGDRPATTHHEALDDLAARGATVRRERVVDDGDLVTCGGVTSGIDLALHLVARELGGDVARRVATRMEHRWGGDGAPPAWLAAA
jgi:transcriptional regulator GlxA family with amidase domain